MTRQLRLTIPAPCHEDWDAMTFFDKGKFCGSCKKEVIDFSAMSDRQIAEFFKKPSPGSVCGRFLPDQLGRNIELPRKRIPWIKYFFQFALPAFLLSIKSSSAKAQGKVVIKKTETSVRNNLQSNALTGDTVLMDEIVVVAETKQPRNNRTSICPRPQASQIANLLSGKPGCGVAPIITKPVDTSAVRDLHISALYIPVKGAVVDDAGFVVPGVSIKIKGTRTGVVADNYGYFKMNVKKGDVLVVNGPGLEITEFITGEERSIEIVVRKAVVGQVEMVAVKRKCYTYAKMPAVALLNNDMPSNYLKIFPNPVAAGSRVTVGAKNIKEGYYILQLLDLSGQSIHRKEIWIDDNKKNLGLNIPVVATGTYFLVLANTRSGKKYTDKIIIQ